MMIHLLKTRKAGQGKGGDCQNVLVGTLAAKTKKNKKNFQLDLIGFFNKGSTVSSREDQQYHTW